MFDSVTCENLNVSYTLSKNLFVRDMLEYCIDNTEVHNVTTALGNFQRFCGKASTVSLSLSLFPSYKIYKFEIRLKLFMIIGIKSTVCY